MLSTVAISLNEFVDCIMVSNLLGQHAMALVNIGTPVMLVFAVIYSMFGTGGAAVFASLSGAHEEKRAGKVYTVTFITASALSAEEMSVYTMSQKEQTKIDCLDILIKVYPEDILIDVRSIGKPLDTAGAKGDFSNLSVLRSAVSSMTYDYVLGMNQTRLIVKRDT